jgi:hypothetical protein
VGYPIVLAQFGPKTSGFRIASAELLSGAGQVQKCYLNTPENDPNLSQCMVLIPASPLKPGTTYSVTVTGTLASGQPLQKTWSFRTKAG